MLHRLLHAAGRACAASSGGLAAAWLLAGCAAYGPGGLPDGADEASAIARMGPPTARYAQAGGERLEFRRGPYGLHTFMLDFDASHRLVRSTQVLNEATFDALAVGQTRDDVLRTIGHPGTVDRIGFQHRDLWSYRYETPICRLFQVELDDAATVVGTGYGRDPMCDPLAP